MDHSVHLVCHYWIIGQVTHNTGKIHTINQYSDMFLGGGPVYSTGTSVIHTHSPFLGGGPVYSTGSGDLVQSVPRTHPSHLFTSVAKVQPSPSWHSAGPLPLSLNILTVTTHCDLRGEDEQLL